MPNDTLMDWGFREDNIEPAPRDYDREATVIRDSVMQEVNIRQAQRDFWQTFYSRYPHLRVHEEEVNTCMQANINSDIGRLPLEDGMAKLAEAAEEYIRHKKWNENRQEDYKGLTDLDGNPAQAPFSDPDDTLGGYIMKRKKARAKYTHLNVGDD